MNVYHVKIEAEDDWYVLELVEDPSIYSQARTLDEAVLMIRDVLALVRDEKDAELQLIVPASLPVDDTKLSGRLTHPYESYRPEDSDDEAEAKVSQARDSLRVSRRSA